MRPLFTIHVGEYLVGSHIEKHFKGYNVWVPSKDTGVDLLVTDRANRVSNSLQVKFSKDYYGKETDAAINRGIKSRGWWTFDRQKIEKSKADYWVLVLHSFHSKDSDFVIVPPKKLLDLFAALDRHKKTINSYLCVTHNSKLCWETRGLRKGELRNIATGKKAERNRNWTKYLNKWPF
jgi:hypothetical protein